MQHAASSPGQQRMARGRPDDENPQPSRIRPRGVRWNCCQFAVELVWASVAWASATSASALLPGPQMAKPATVAAYIAGMPPAARRALRQLRTAIKAAAPGMTERISYSIPTFELAGRYVLYIAAFKEHVSVYPVTSGMLAKLGKAIAPYRAGKGTLRFPLDAPIPVDLVARLAKVRVRELRAESCELCAKSGA